MIEAFVRGVVAGLGIAMPVGAIAVLIIETGRKWRFRIAVGAGLGAALVAGMGPQLNGWFLLPFVAGVFLASFAWQCLLAATGAFMGERLPAWAGRLAGLLGSLVIAVLAVRVALGE